jgi:hypothetical protein
MSIPSYLGCRRTVVVPPQYLSDGGFERYELAFERLLRAVGAGLRGHGFLG